MKKIFGKQWKAVLVSIGFIIVISLVSSFDVDVISTTIWLILLHVLYLIINFIYSFIVLIKGLFKGASTKPFRLFISFLGSVALLVIFGGLYLIIFAGVLVVLLPFLA